VSLSKTLAKLNAPLARYWYKKYSGARILMYHHCIALTFDDGYLDNLTNALPVLEKHDAAATIYVTSAFAAQTQRHSRYPNEPGRLHLNWQEVKRLAKHPLIEIGSHTVSHPMLSELSDTDAKIQVEQSKKEIEDNIGQSVSSFCYPAGNFTARDKQFVKTCGYQNATSVKPGVTRDNCDRYALRRTEITYKDTIDNLQLKIDGAYDVFHHLLDIRREQRFAKQRSQAKPD